MLNIVTALKYEALPIIKHFNLKFKNGIYKNENINLIITGQGKIKSALNTALLVKEYRYPTLNIGICGSSIHSVNSGFFIYKITDTDSSFHYYPDFFLQPSEEIFTVSQIKTYYPLVDMESSGFFEGCYKFLNVNEIILYKIVSDTPVHKPDIREVPELIRNHLNVIESLQKKLSAKNAFFEEINLSLAEAKAKMKLTKSQENQLKNILTYYKIKNKPFPQFQIIKEKEEVKKFITSLIF